MKKILTIVILAFACLLANAQPSNIDELEQAAYFKNTTLQIGSTGTIDLYLKYPNEWNVGAIQYHFTLPEGVTLKDVNVPGDYTPPQVEGGYTVLGGLKDKKLVATLTVEVSPEMVPGDYDMVITDYMMSDDNDISRDIIGENIVSTLTIQKTAVIEPLDANNDIEIIPFEFTGGGNFDEPINAAILMKSESYVKSLEFDFELPAGISVPSIEEDGDVIYAEPELENNKGAVSVEITMNEDGTYHYSLSGTSTKYIYAADEMTQFSTLPLMSENPVADGVYTIKIYNISMTTKNDAFEGGNYYASVIVGQPAQEEAILYGHFTSDAASTFTTALKNVAIADVTAATVDDGAKFTDVLVNEKGGNSYYTRTAANFATTVLPLDLPAANVDELYMIESMDAESIVLTEVDNVAANTPCIFKGTINVEGATPTLGVPSEQSLGQTTYKGTYSATSIAADEGYYIYNGKFYGDGASISPFRGYFEGNVRGVKSLSIKLNTADGLIDITDQLSDEAIYSLQGIHMNNAQKGINIKGGKKVYVK